ncbi:ArsR family transcriptional regulator [Halomicrobium mukohataei]|uniref:ArsR family transcriptional regulator n=1 Tax=Halomicrobium mukohataei TaxID=57705 RepID=A0A847UB60_9EURY|nr:helix-turn-helix transcriptional regulator [Halomicrobium mukohataei]NLV09477.1 ArsR family transcriptional regulator [Halomicrobium mukohataei]
MSKGTPAPGGNDSDRDGLDTWEALRAITQETRASLIADIVGHPEGMISVPELDYLNPDIERSAITEHLDVLLDTGVLAKATIPVGERSRDLPYTFYYVTEAGRDLFDRNDIFDEAIWREQYETVQKTPAIREIEGMDRPEPN